ncbi:MAG: hypothetical protein MUE50_11875 [Pirellulaceae bacterium]|nr:hypothetical protein [Pirellulaceae bacterium]
MPSYVKENGGSVVNGGLPGVASGRLSATPPNFAAVHRAASLGAPTVGSAARPGACIASHKIGSNRMT